MKRLLSIVMCAAAYAQPRVGPQIYWPYPIDDTTTSNLALSAAATWGAVGFIASGSRTLSEIHIAIVSTTGSLTSGDLRLALYANNGAKPGTEIEGINSSGTPSSGWNSITGFGTSVTAGTAYWIVYRNMDATPASNFFTVSRRTISASGVGGVASTTNMNQWSAANSTDSGTNWTRSVNISPIVLVWSDGTREGFPITGGTQCQIYSARECGLLFNTGGTALRVAGVAGMVSKTGTPTGAARFRIYEGSGASRTLIATTTGTSSDGTTTVGYMSLLFGSTQILKANTTYTVALAETTQSDASTNRLNVSGYAVKSDSTALMSSMFGGGTSYTLTTNGSTWSDTANEYPHITLLLDTSRPFVIPNGGFTIQ